MTETFGLRDGRRSIDMINLPFEDAFEVIATDPSRALTTMQLLRTRLDEAEGAAVTLSRKLGETESALESERAVNRTYQTEIDKLTALEAQVAEMRQTFPKVLDELHRFRIAYATGIAKHVAAPDEAIYAAGLKALGLNRQEPEGRQHYWQD